MGANPSARPRASPSPRSPPVASAAAGRRPAPCRPARPRSAPKCSSIACVQPEARPRSAPCGWPSPASPGTPGSPATRGTRPPPAGKSSAPRAGSADGSERGAPDRRCASGRRLPSGHGRRPARRTAPGRRRASAPRARKCRPASSGTQWNVAIRLPDASRSAGVVGYAAERMERTWGRSWLAAAGGEPPLDRGVQRTAASGANPVSASAPGSSLPERLPPGLTTAACSGTIAA